MGKHVAFSAVGCTRLRFLLSCLCDESAVASWLTLRTFTVQSSCELLRANVGCASRPTHDESGLQAVLRQVPAALTVATQLHSVEAVVLQLPAS